MFERLQSAVLFVLPALNLNFRLSSAPGREIANFVINKLTPPLMRKKLLYLVLIPGFLLSCESNEKPSLQSQVDSLQIELEKSHQTSQTLAEIGTLLDSIDATRQLLRINLVEGTPYEDYAGRMSELNDYIRQSETRIHELEQSLRSSQANAQAFAKTIKQLKKELANRNQEMAFLQEQVEQFRNENENLIITVNLQDAEIADKQEQIDAKSQELALIEERVQQLMIEAKITEAEAYFLRAQAIETAAERTKLAPRKRKETMSEALDLYKKALSLGKSEAQAKINELEDRL